MSRRREDTWLKTYWRPAMAWQYMVVCLYDFIGGPIMTAWISYTTSTAYVEWKSLTLEGSGLYHLAMGAIIGVTAWSRGQEKIQTTLLDGSVRESQTETTTQTPTGN